MANELINPFQQFKDQLNNPLANGQLKVYVNKTTTIGTAFSDSALTIPQVVNPYRLDSAGRVRGDLRWQGKRTIELLTANGAHVRTLDDVVTLVDTSEFAINVASVAAMVALTTLELGDVVETQSYNADQGQGGARYLIVAAATGTNDGFLYHNLDNGLQAQLLDTEYRNFYLAGAVGNGIADDSTAVQAVLTQGGDIYVPTGTFLAAGLTLSVSARLHGEGTIKAAQFTTSDLLTITGVDLTITFDGLTLDFDMTNQTVEQAFVSVKSQVTATVGAVVSFNNVTFANGGKYDVQMTGNDGAVRPFYQFSECRFLAGQESTATPYVAAYVRAEDGASLQMENCYFDLETTPAAIGGRGGVNVGRTAGALTNPGFASVSSSTFNRVGGNADAANIIAAIQVSDAENVIIADNRILSPQGAGIRIDANVDQLLIAENQVDALTGTNVLGQIVVTATADPAPGNNWKIENNQCLDSNTYGIYLDGASAGVNPQWVEVVGNMITGPSEAAIRLDALIDVKVEANFIDMALVDGFNGIEVGPGGIDGNVSIEGNTVLNCLNATGIIVNENSSNAVVSVADNLIQGTAANAMNGIELNNVQDAYVRGNALREIITTLITLGGTGGITTALVHGNSYDGTDPATWLTNAGNITNLRVAPDNQWKRVQPTIDTIASAATIIVTSEFVKLTGTTQIQDITPDFIVEGAELTLFGSDANSRNIVNTGNINLGASPRALGQDDILRLAYDGANWNEIGFSVNS